MAEPDAETTAFLLSPRTAAPAITIPAHEHELEASFFPENEVQVEPGVNKNYCTTFMLSVIGNIIFLSVFCFYFTVFQNASDASRFNSYLSAAAALFMMLSIIIISHDIIRWRIIGVDASEQDVQHISNTVIVFIGALTIITFAGHLKSISTSIIIFKYEIKLMTCYLYEAYLKLIYVIIFLPFLPFIFAYTIIFAPLFKIHETKANILLITLWLCFLQKWTNETLTINEHICLEMLEENRTCKNRREDSLLKYLTYHEWHWYKSLIQESPYIYTCTMELLPAIGALLITLKRRAHRVAENVAYNNVKISKVGKRSAYILLFLAVLVLFISLPFLPMLRLLHKNRETREWFLIGHGLYRIISQSLSFSLLYIVWLAYRQPKRVVPDPESEYSENYMRKLASIFKFPIDLPDLAIMVISGMFTLVLQTIKCILHICAYFVNYTPMNYLAIAQFVAHDIANFIQLASFFVQYQVTRTFLTFDEDSMKRLRMDKFVVHFAPIALTINVLHFGKIYWSNANHLPPYQTGSEFYDNVLTVLHSAYPGSLLFLMTAALCWAHIIERLYKVGAYRIISNVETVGNDH